MRPARRLQGRANGIDSQLVLLKGDVNKACSSAARNRYSAARSAGADPSTIDHRREAPAMFRRVAGGERLSAASTPFGRAMLGGTRVAQGRARRRLHRPNRDGSKSIALHLLQQQGSLRVRTRPGAAGRAVRPRSRPHRRRTGARRFIAYFQAYTNTYAHVDELRALYIALAAPTRSGWRSARGLTACRRRCSIVGRI
jgi:hypothetical protein